MRSVITAAVVIFLGATNAQTNFGEKDFRRLEKNVQTAKSLRLVSTLEGVDKGKKVKLTISSQFDDGNKYRLECKGEIDSKPFASLRVSDGKQMGGSDLGQAGDVPLKMEPTPPNMNKKLAAIFIRGLPFMGSVSINSGELSDIDKWMPVDSFKFDWADDKGSSTAPSRVHYSVTIGEHGKFKVQLDTPWKRELPSKRRLTAEDGTSLTEIFKKFEINPLLTDGLFELPR